MDQNSTKPYASIPSALELTMMRGPALVAAGLAPPTSTAALAIPTVQASASGPPGLGAPPTVNDLLAGLRRRWLLAAITATAAAAVTVAAVFIFMPPKYQAEARLLVASRGERSIGNDYREDTEFVIFKANLPSLLKAPLNLSSALNQKITDTKFARDLSIVRERGSDAVEWLDKAVKTDYNLGPEILKVTLGAERGDEVADLLNAIVQSFLYDLEHKEKGRADDHVDQLQNKQKDLDQELSRFRRQLVEREKTLKLPNLSEQAKKFEIAAARLGTIEKEIIKNRLDTIQAKQEFDSHVDRQKNIAVVPVPDDDLNNFLRNDPRAQGLFLELTKAEKELQEFVRVSPNSAGVYLDKRDRIKKLVDDQREELRPDLEKAWRLKFSQDLKIAEIAQSDKIKSLDKQAEVLEELAKQTRAEVALYTPGIQNAPAEILSLRDSIASMEKATGKVMEEITVLRANPSKVRVTLLQRATEPQAKDVSRQTKIAGAGGLGVFGLVLVAVAFFEFRTRKVGTARDVIRNLGMTVLGTVPPMPMQSRKPIAGGASQQDMYWQSRLMESIDAIRTMLVHTARDDSLRIIMITSAVGGEGKTSLASQLAASLARAWKRTLLIDGDLRNPATHKLFNVPLDPGFSEVLRGEAEAAQAIRATSISRLWTMPAGHWDAHAVQALAQEQVRTMFQTLKQQYDFIIVDSCPVLPVADSLLLGQHVDGVIFSVMRDVSRIPAVWAAQQRLQNLGVRTLGAVVFGDQGDDLGDATYKYALASAAK